MFKTSEEIPHCKHFVIRKKRYCKMTLKAGEEYCGEHQKITTEDQIDESDKNCKLRIVCPLDRKHTCYAYNLKKHLKICNARVTNVEPFISKGINYSSDSEDEDCRTLKALSEFTTTEIKETVKKINYTFEKFIKGEISEKISTHELIETEMLKPEYGDKAKKHLKQASSILGLLQKYDLMIPNTCYIEFGAGRGQLSYWISLATEKDNESKVLVVERASPKHKRDNKISKTSDRVRRIRADISDLVLNKIDEVSNSKKVVGVAKHLCGEATDLALRCLTKTVESKETVSGGVFTFCCHHRCRWAPYTGKEFFKQNQLDKNDFDIMCGVASWATCGTGVSRERRSKFPEEIECLRQNERDIEIGLSRLEKEEVGRRSKYILNWGRKIFLEKFDFKSKLHYYVDKNVSLENVCIVIYK